MSSKSLFFFTGGSGKVQENERQRKKEAQELLSAPAYPDLYEKLKIERTEKQGLRDIKKQSFVRGQNDLQN